MKIVAMKIVTVLLGLTIAGQFYHYGFLASPQREIPVAENIGIKSLKELKPFLRGILRNVFGTIREFGPKPSQDLAYAVPLKLHFIWITTSMKTQYKNNLRTYRELNKNYEMNLWVDNRSWESVQSLNDDISNLHIHNIDDDDIKLKMTNFYLFTEGENVGVLADLLRYEVIYMEGGIYCDLDSAAVKPFDGNFLHSFVAHNAYSPYYNICNGVFGFPKGCNFLKYVLNSLKYNFDRASYPPAKTGPTFFTTTFVLYNDTNIHMIDQKYLVHKTNESYTWHSMDGSWQ